MRKISDQTLCYATVYSELTYSILEGDGKLIKLRNISKPGRFRRLRDLTTHEVSCGRCVNSRELL